MEQDRNLAYEVHEQFENGTAFIDSLDLRRDIKRCVNFEAGRQWNMGDDVADFPKITLNVIKQIGKVRKSGILQNEYSYLINSNNFKSVRKIQDFLGHIAQTMKLKRIDLKIVNDTFTKGTGICYFYWDAQSRGFMSKSGGRLKAEAIDIRRFRVADPYITDIQEQEYVIFVSRERIDSIKKHYGVDVVADETDYASDTEKPLATEDETRKFTNVYTKFYRNDEGQVIFVITTEHDVLQKPTALNPFYNGKLSEEPNTTSLMDNVKQRNFANVVFDLYPFVSLSFDERDNCFYGLPGALELIEAQKSINQHFSIYDKGIQDNVLGGFILRRGLLGDQELTTENGQVLNLDLMPGEDWRTVFGRVPVNNIPNDALNYSGNLLGVVRQVSGASNIQIGSADYAGQSGKQTEMLLQRARENSSDYAMLFNEYKKDQAMIMFMFAKFFYDNEDFTVVEHGVKQDSVREYVGEEKFNGNEYIKDDVRVDVRVGPAPSFSEYTALEMLGMMVQSGQAPLEVYLTNLPDGYINNRDELLKVAENNSLKREQQYQAQLKQYEEVMKQMTAEYQRAMKDKSNVDAVIAENQRLKSMLAEVASKNIKASQNVATQNMELTSDMRALLEAQLKHK